MHSSEVKQVVDENSEDDGKSPECVEENSALLSLLLLLLLLKQIESKENGNGEKMPFEIPFHY